MTHTEKTIKNMEADVFKKSERVKEINRQKEFLEIELSHLENAISETQKTIQKLKQ